MKDDNIFGRIDIQKYTGGMAKNFVCYTESSIVPRKTWIGIDWAKDSGMNRGDVIKREDNVTHVRFKAVTPY